LRLVQIRTIGATLAEVLAPTCYKTETQREVTGPSSGGERHVRLRSPTAFGLCEGRAGGLNPRRLEMRFLRKGRSTKTVGDGGACTAMTMLSAKDEELEVNGRQWNQDSCCFFCFFFFFLLPHNI